MTDPKVDTCPRDLLSLTLAGMILCRRNVRAMCLALISCAAFVAPLVSMPTAGAQDVDTSDATGATVDQQSPGTDVGTTSDGTETAEDVAAADEDDSDLARITTTFKVGGEPISGIEMIVSLDGTEIGSDVSDEDGRAEVPVPGPGQYEVTLDESSMPEGVSLKEGAPATLKPRVLGNNNRPVIFKLTTVDHSAVSGPSSFERLANLFASGLRFGLVIALAAVGLSLIFGTTGLTNFAHGELLTFGAIATWFLNADNGGLGIPLPLAAVGGVVLGTLFGASFDQFIYAPLRRRGMPIISQMVISIGLALATRYMLSVIFGASAKQYSQYTSQRPTVHLGPVDLRPKDLVISAIAFVALIAVGLFLQRARLGTAIRAVSDNPSLSIASGINDNRVILIVWGIAGGLGALAGVLLSSTEGVQWNMGQHVLLIMFAAVLLGGLGTTFGAMIGGIFVGVVSDMSTFWLDADLKIVVALATLVLVLLVKPSGVFGVRVRKA